MCRDEGIDLLEMWTRACDLAEENQDDIVALAEYLESRGTVSWQQR